MSDLWNPLLLSLRIAATATALGALVAAPLALFMSRRKFKGKSVIEGIIVVPMVMPPTVVGYAIITLFGTNGWLGRWIYRAFNYSIIFRVEGAVLAAAVVALPMLYLPAKAGFAAVNRELEETARLMGANRRQVFWHVSLPLARNGLYSGLLLAFARALGEFGATVMVFGWQANKLTLPISIYADYEQGDMSHAAAAVVALTAISLALTMAYNRSSAGLQ
ncbi:MAG TPA: molybdate ABC transporter permease subunit [Tepidisphaeraceae bacterium]|jgi:molybdate transport system permease protein|nr:molybdate ABC transporter permease subunit [Tepidisphaeraceae bacterium]